MPVGVAKKEKRKERKESEIMNTVYGVPAAGGSGRGQGAIKDTKQMTLAENEIESSSKPFSDLYRESV
jgi:hypothetical protein